MRDAPSARSEPALNLPAFLLALIAAIVLIHAARAWMPDTTDLAILFGGGFVPVQWSVMLGWTDLEAALAAAASDPAGAEIGTALVRYAVEDTEPHAWSLATYALLHGSWLHVGLNCVWLAAFGTPVVRRIGNARASILALTTAVAGALAYWAANPLSAQVMIGASATVSGFMGAAATFVFEDGRGDPAAAEAGRLSAVRRLLRNRTALGFLGVWFITNIATGLFAAPLGIAEGGIAWQAHIGGLVAGLLLFPFLDPGRVRRGT